MRTGSSPHAFLRLAGHPVRWRLLTELAQSDRHVRELTILVGRPQSLVSYHLGRLKAAELVISRRSSADARDAYYSADLEQCGQRLAMAGGAIHPALRFAPPQHTEVPGSKRARVLFLCTGNSARSQIAEAVLQDLSISAEAFSAGSHPKSLHPNAVRVMRERGIDIANRRTKPLTEFLTHEFDYVISLCDRVREVCPEFPGQPNVLHWSIADPASAGLSDDETYPAFQRTAVEVEKRIRFFLHVLDAPV